LIFDIPAEQRGVEEGEFDLVGNLVGNWFMEEKDKR
jgi:hypothetical protein